MKVRNRSHGSSARKRVVVSKVAPPHTSAEYSPRLSIRAAMGSMSSMRSRVARRLWCASRNVVSVILRGAGIRSFPGYWVGRRGSASLLPSIAGKVAGSSERLQGSPLPRVELGRTVGAGFLLLEVGPHRRHQYGDNGSVPPTLAPRHRGIVPCFFAGRTSRLFLSISRAAMIRGLVSVGSITSSITPRLAAT